MRRDTDMIVRHLPGDEVEIFPIADIHLGAQEHNAKEWKSFCGSFLARPNAYLILVGDLIDNGTRSSVTDVFKATMPPSTQKRMMAEMLLPLKERIIAVVPGNHCARSGKDADDDPCLDICSKLDIEDLYRPNAAFIKIQMGVRGEHGANRPAWTICATHGAGGGIYTGAAVNRNERFGNVIDGLDILIVGHTHKAHVTKPMKIVIDPRNEIVTQKPFYVVGVGAWMEFGGYAMRKMLLPSSPALQVIRLNRFGKKTTVETV